jgi:glycosyltransferase involved in cell wall biosynthesis
MKFSIIVPCYNEEKYILEVLKKIQIQKKKYDIEIIVVDDCSTDNSTTILKNNYNLYDRLIINDVNGGKGNSIKKAVNYVTGDITLVQDADLEYDPNDYNLLFSPFFDNDADVVFGTRFNNGKKVRVFYFTHKIANFFITILVNCLTNINFSDVETGFKAIKTTYLKKLKLKENSFAIEIEIAMKLSKIENIKIYEVGISYSGRTYAEGKKIKFIDAFIALIAIFKYKFLN